MIQNSRKVYNLYLQSIADTQTHKPWAHGVPSQYSKQWGEEYDEISHHFQPYRQPPVNT